MEARAIVSTAVLVAAAVVGVAWAIGRPRLKASPGVGIVLQTPASKDNDGPRRGHLPQAPHTSQAQAPGCLLAEGRAAAADDASSEAASKGCDNGSSLRDSIELEELWEAAQSALDAQPGLRAKVAESLAAFPRAFLYDDEEQADPAVMVRGFAAFLRYIRDALRDSPRNLLLRDLTRRCMATLSCGDAVRRAAAEELYTLLRVAQGEPFLRLVEKFDALTPGRTYQRWKSAAAAAAKALIWECSGEDSALVERRVRAGLEAKAIAKSGCGLTDMELAKAMGKIRSQARARQASQQALAAVLEKTISSDLEYRRFVRSRELWEASGFASLWREYLMLDHEEGETRRARGEAFEDAWAEMLFAMVVQIMLGAASRQVWERGRFRLVRNVRWQKATGGAAIGEVDLAVVEEGTAVALVEMKAGVLEVAAAASQHKQRVAAALSDAEDPTKLVAKDGSDIPLSPSVEIYVGTLVPRHRRFIGVEPKIVRAVGEALFDMKRYYTKAGMVCAPAEQDAVSGYIFNGSDGSCLRLDDEEPVAIFRQTLRSDPSLRERLRISPLEFVRTSSNLLVLDSDEVESWSARSGLGTL